MITNVQKTRVKVKNNATRKGPGESFDLSDFLVWTKSDRAKLKRELKHILRTFTFDE